MEKIKLGVPQGSMSFDIDICYLFFNMKDCDFDTTWIKANHI